MEQLGPAATRPGVAGDAADTADADAASVDRLLQGLNAEQRRAVTSTDSPLRILAGAGSGKTRVLTHRIAHGALTDTLDPQRVLAVTFTRKAAGELRERLGRLGLRHGVHAGTFHAIAYAQLRQRWEERGVRPPELLDRKVGFVARLMPGRDRTAPLDVVAEIEWAAARRVPPDRYEEAAAAAHRRPPLAPARVAAVYGRYEEQKRRRRLVDFDDLLRLAARDLAADPVYASARHWRYRHLFVDEFQDVNPLQFQLLRAWMGPESDLCVVGDPNQAIYAWNGADARYLVDFDTYFPGGGTVTLSENYRSSPQILAVANAVLAVGGGSAGGAGGTAIELRPNRPSGPLPTVRTAADETDEARMVARALRDAHRPGVPWSQQAVLVRTNAQAAVMAEVLQSAGIPHRVRGSANLLEQPEVRQALAAVRRAPNLEVALADLEADAMGPGPGPDAGPGAAATADTGDRSEGRDAAAEPTIDLRAPSHLTEERRANLAELVRLGHEYVALDPGGGVAAFLAWLTSTLRSEDRVGGDVVDVVTFHAAKGLEWAVVHVAGLEEGFVPIHHAQEDPDALDEERRLLYVALTRAREELHCSWARRRAFGSRSLNRSPSPWLAAVQTAVGVAPGELSRSEGARRARRARAAVGASGAERSGRKEPTDAADRRLFAALREWRRRRAAAADVPAFVVFDDRTLTALAEQRPRTRAQLLSVPGIGPAKAERFGDEVLALIAGAD